VCLCTVTVGFRSQQQEFIAWQGDQLRGVIFRKKPNAKWYFTAYEGKFDPRTGHEGPEEEWRYTYTLSLTSALDEGW